LKAVILARGLGTRMKQASVAASLTTEQAMAADLGMKAMMPVVGQRPFIYYVLSTLADAGVKEVCMVVAPDSGDVQRHFHHEMTLRRLRISFAIQAEALGTANAVLAAEDFAGSDRFLVLNSDNLYPAEACRALLRAEGCAVAGFDRAALVREGNIDDARIRRYALLWTTPDGFLERIVEKPDEATFVSTADRALVGMNLWAFTPIIFEACRRVNPSPRGELELPDAVRIAMTQLGVPIRVFPFSAGVLDLSNRGDVATVSRALKDARVIL
jgi:glucose-1-phosphate thymidylyltransferase